MKLTDEIIDTAENLASLGILPNDASPTEVVSEVSKTIRVNLSPNSTGGRLAVAVFNKYAALAQQVNAIC